MSSFLRCLVLVAVTAENPASHKKDDRNDNRVLSAVVAISGYSSKTLIQNIDRVVVSNVVLRPPSFEISCTYMLHSPCLLTNGSQIHSLPVCGYFVVGK